MTQPNAQPGSSAPEHFDGPSGDPTKPGDDRETRLGVLAALGAYGSWGFLTLYYAALTHVDPLEVVANRVTWSLVVLGTFFALRQRWSEVWASMRDRRTLLALCASSLLISVNWLTYIWAVTNGQATEASLGYFIVPLFNVALGYVLLSERLSRLQMIAIGLAMLAILLQLVLLGSLPIVSILLAFTFGSYGYIRKTVSVGANLGLLIELVLIAPVAIGFVIYLQITGQGHLDFSDPVTSLLLVLTGVVTYLPLMWFSAAAQRLRLSTVGIIQYMNPTIQFLLAVFVLQEALSLSKLATFCLIWVSVGLYSFDALRAARNKDVN